MDELQVSNYEGDGIRFCIVIFAVSLVLVKFFLKLWNDLYLSPPGPWGFPILGHLPLLGSNPARTLMNISKTYGDVFKIRMGSWPTIVLNSREAIREALMDHGEVFSDRPEFYTGISLYNMKSLAFGSYTPRWKMHRKIANHVLRQFVSAKNNPTEDVINKEIETVIKSFLKRKGNHFSPQDDIYLGIGCIIYQLCFGSARNCSEDENFLQFIKNNEIFVETAGSGNPLNVMPWLRFVMPWKAIRFQKLIALNTTVVSSEVNEHVKSYDNNHHRDITDGLISAADQYGNSPELYNGITKEEILSSLTDFIGAGFETVSTTLQWIILYLSYHNDVQRRVQEEIYSVIGDRTPKLTDKGKLPFTEATILEVIRVANVLPMAIPHSATTDTVFRNHKIKKGTVVFCNTYATARDPKLWTNPEEFSPERFLDNHNQIDQQKADEVLTFGIGRRRCPGEFLAKMELFLFAVNIFQRFEIELCSKPDFEPIFGLTCKPVPYQIKVTERC
ncbi:cytochrome P450 1A1-like [Mytilus californianus]|uniref:cytochrome P450 1A1-like n=1 Tax=Mytilus californianus TaxID=6549 RepID=UPI00224515A3|nr:cytochrome P450 1A1-like [Mytilus californianus]